jgi:hypothetical protein
LLGLVLAVASPGAGSYAAHKALNDLYDALPGHADDLAEGFQGAAEKLLSYKTANIEYSSFFGKKIPLIDRYKRFKEVGLREKILTEIKNNLIEEVPYKL